MVQPNEQSKVFTNVAPIPERARDAVDHELLVMSTPIWHINEDSLRYSETTKSMLVNEWRECAKLNRGLNTEQRVKAVELLSSGPAEMPLLAILCIAADH